jgi:hypothetical protein
MLKLLGGRLCLLHRKGVSTVANLSSRMGRTERACPHLELANSHWISAKWLLDKFYIRLLPSGMWRHVVWYKCFGGTCCYLLAWTWSSRFFQYFTGTTYQRMWHYILEDNNLNIHCCQNLIAHKSYVYSDTWKVEVHRHVWHPHQSHLSSHSSHHRCMLWRHIENCYIWKSLFDNPPATTKYDIEKVVRLNGLCNLYTKKN